MFPRSCWIWPSTFRRTNPPIDSVFSRRLQVIVTPQAQGIRRVQAANMGLMR